MNIKVLLAQLLPVCLYNYILHKRHSKTFINGFKDYLNNSGPESWVFKEENLTYQSIVSVQGLGYSGSGAVLDLLCEAESCDVVGTSNELQRDNDHNGLYEFDFLRLSGCIFEIERFLNSTNIFQNDSLINRFIDYLNGFHLCKVNPSIRELFFKFLANIIELQIFDIKGVPYNPHLAGNKQTSSIFFLKQMEIADYRDLCRLFLIQFFNRINTYNKDCLVFDQLLCDFGCDYSRYSDYIPNVKVILVYRDPRDIYVFAKTHIEQDGWMAHENADQFIEWYKILTRNIDKTSKEILVVQFEKLVNNYEVEKKRIFDYIGMECSEGKAKERTIFIPEVSRKNIGLWKCSNLPESDFEKIASELSDYCYFD